MIDNLTISATGLTVPALDNTNTNIPSTDNSYYYLTPLNTRHSGRLNNSVIKSASDPVVFSTSYTTYPQVGYRAKNTTDNSTGNSVSEDTAYYNFYTATLGYSYYRDGKSSGSSPKDICPKGWKLPKISDDGTSIAAASSEFANLARSYNDDASWASADTSVDYYTSDSIIRTGMVEGNVLNTSNGYAGFTYTCYYNGTSLLNVGSSGYYWSSSVYNSDYSYSLNFDTSSVRPQNYNYKSLGLAVRCIAK